MDEPWRKTDIQQTLTVRFSAVGVLVFIVLVPKYIRFPQ